ncbi:MAG: BACON domain-containing protein [Alistipes sp.]|nr:BACON domain-containing protein [Alistipes sp.]
MKRFLSLFALVALMFTACEKESAEQSQTSVEVSQELVEFTTEGGEAEVSVTTKGSGNITVKEDASWLEAKVSGSVIKLTAKANDAAATREVEVAVKYGTAEAKFTVKQAGSEYDVVFEAKRFEGVYFGTEYSDTPNYYIILSDVGVNTDASAKANGTYYYFDMYRNIVADELNPVLPEGEYKFDATNSYADKTFSDESSWYAVTGADGKPTKSASFKEATVTVKSGKFSAIITMEDDTTHYVSYEGNLVATTYITTLVDDTEFAVKDAQVSATCYGDTYEKGQQTWFIEAVKGDDYFCVEVLAPSADSCDGIYQALASSGVTDYANKFIPGLIGEDGLIGTWYAKLTDGVIKGDALAPMVGGMIQLTTENNTLTINYSTKDDAGNNITGSVSGTLK